LAKPDPKAGSWLKAETRLAGAAPRLVWKVLSRGETDRIVQRSRELGLIVNTSLLVALSEAIVGRVDASGPVMMQVLVNMRVQDGTTSCGDPTGNHVGLLNIQASGKTPTEVQEQVRAGLQRGLHWASWQAGIAPRLFGKAVARQQLKFLFNRLQFSAALSNLGSFTEGPDDGSAWVFAPPISKFNPLAAGAVTWNGRLGLCLHLDPQYGEPDAILERWVEHLLAPEKRKQGAPASKSSAA
jgi:hypothetical protein